MSCKVKQSAPEHKSVGEERQLRGKGKQFGELNIKAEYISFPVSLKIPGKQCAFFTMNHAGIHFEAVF